MTEEELEALRLKLIGSINRDNPLPFPVDILFFINGKAEAIEIFDDLASHNPRIFSYACREGYRIDTI